MLRNSRASHLEWRREMRDRLLSSHQPIKNLAPNGMRKRGEDVGIRVLDVKLTGSLSSKKVMIQAAPMVCPYVTVGGSSDMSSGVFSPVVLTR